MDPPGRHPTKLAILISQHTVRPCREVRLSVEEDGGHFACSSRGAFERDKKGFPGDLAWLKFVFGSSAVAALDLVDQHSVTRIVSPSGRAVYQVLGSSGKLYTCYTSCHFCTCPAFAFSVLRKNNSLMCKHILAMYLSQATGACQELSVSDQQLASILLAEEEEEGLGTMC
ncbi:zinc finger SWIM domain-containing protein 7 isoform X1 [Gopherus flavomarginatus]|uniref:zinc finger SWIM domain-containing protein 7 isoform X1 n=1 Tax=Gopherus flavomarginatus TaxID=286002 RepID=UPI0021CBF776|nr:zinc finger SWIM domain-containing protein 7 isoform X1 [Gopherus flavomarginatus]